MSLTASQIGNIALRLLGQARVTDITAAAAGTPGYDVYSEMAVARQEILRSYSPNFATKRVCLSENYLLQSEDFGTTWTTSNATVTQNSLRSPDGLTTADTLTDADGTNAGYVTQSVTVPNNSDDWMVTVYLFQGTAALSAVYAGLSGGTGVTATGIVTWGATPTIDTGTIEDIGDGWWRVRLPIANNATGNTTLAVRIYPAGTTGSAQGTVYAWGAQINRGSSASGYTATTTAARRTIVPPFRFAYGHSLPTDWLRTIDVNDGDVQYKEEGAYLLHSSASINLRYVFDQSDYTVWDTIAGKLLAAQVATDLCVGLTGSDSRMDLINKYRKEIRSVARTVDAQEDGTDPPVVDTWELARSAGVVRQAP